MEMVMMVAAILGMVCRGKTKRFMRIPPNSIPRAADGRFTAPGGEGEGSDAQPGRLELNHQEGTHASVKKQWRCAQV